MKKNIILILLTLTISVSIFAKDSEVNLNSSIEETNVTYSLVYNNDTIEDGTTDYDIYIYEPLTRSGNTNWFLVYATSNMNSDLPLEVNINPGSFKTELNDGAEVYDSEIVPTVFIPLKISYLPAGKIDNAIVSAFVLYWEGDSSLPAGDYVSNVNIEYSIN
ncbi:MAG: hypothetical protein PQJ44_00015 [Sphaerochaetaceae bacterium]|nr:hypothetical protein [Sphaerochaetaceae bacterium]